jgi:hypothetical protein
MMPGLDAPAFATKLKISFLPVPELKTTMPASPISGCCGSAATPVAIVAVLFDSMLNPPALM